MVAAGYNAKIIEVPGEWLGNSAVAEILSVSECVSTSPIEHTLYWLCTPWLLYESEARLAEAVTETVAETLVEAERLRWFFYEVDEQELHEGVWRAVEGLPEGITSPTEGYVRRGYDIVTFSVGTAPECSPLSCNGGAQHFPVNRFCLVDCYEQAKEIVGEVERAGGYEPGPYRIMTVWEKIAYPLPGRHALS